MHKRRDFKIFLMIIMFMYLTIVGGCGGGGGGNSPSAPLRLSGLQLSSVTLSPAFSPATLQYTASVANSVDSITVTPATSANATITVNGANLTGGGITVNLNVGSNVITIVVSNSTGSTTYTVMVTRESVTPDPIPTLSNLQLSAGVLSPTFSATTLQYTANVVNSVTSVTVTPTTTATATITVNGANVASGSASGAINLNVGSNVITIVVSNSAGSTTYTATVTRESFIPTPDPIPTLSNLQLSTGTLTPVFNAATLQYTVSVANSITSVTVTPTTTSANASITINGTTVTVGSMTVNLNVGSNTITIVVSNSSGSTTYTVTATRANVAPDPIATLSNLQLSAGTLTPAFSAATLQYTASAANSVGSINVTPTTMSANASITVNGTNVPSGSASGAINLNVGSNTITIIASNSTGSTTYTVTVTRDSPSNAIYHKITQPEALIMMSQTSGYIILDVRWDYEYDEKHIRNPNNGQEAMLIPYTEVGARAATELPNKAQYIYVYCKAGVRSEIAARDLVGLGYTNVYDFGGLDDWPYPSWTVSGPPPTYWSDLADISWWSASGTNFTISTAEEFAAIAALSINGTTSFAGQTITLTSNIDLAGTDWATIDYFEGVFDGGGHSISNIRIESSGSGVGLFGTLAAGGTIKNFTLREAEIIICPA